jgi:hypothetical protein
MFFINKLAEQEKFQISYPGVRIRYVIKTYMAPKKRNGLITILTTSNSAIAVVAKSMLEEANIKYSLDTDGYKDNSIPTNTTFRIQVGQADAVKGKMLLADLEEINFEG